MKRKEYFKLILIFLIFIMSVNQTLYANYSNSTLDYLTKSWKFYFFIGFLIFMIFLEIINNYLDKRLKPPKFTDNAKINNRYGLNDDEKDYDTTSQNIVEKIGFNDKKFNIVDVEKEVVRKSKVMLEEKKVKIEFNLSEEINVFADDFYIEQVISNYITNAIKHVKEIDGKKVISIVNEVNIKYVLKFLIRVKI